MSNVQITRCKFSSFLINLFSSFCFQLIAEVDRYTEHALEKLTNDILKARERIHVILNKLSVGDVSNDSKYAILYTSKRKFNRKK